MKNMFIAIAMVFISNTLFAQQLEIGVNGGLMFSQDPGSAYVTDIGYFYENQNIPFSTYGCNIKYIWKRNEYGVAEDFRSRTVNEAFYTNTPANGFAYFKNSEKENVTRFFMHRRRSIKRFETYIGFSLSLISTTDNRKIRDNNVSIESLPPSPYRTAIGVDEGVTYFITKNIGINAALAIDIYLKTKPGYGGPIFTAIPFSAGIHYRIGKSAPTSRKTKITS